MLNKVQTIYPNYNYISLSNNRTLNEDRILITNKLALVLDGHAYRKGTLHVVDLVVKYFPEFLEQYIDASIKTTDDYVAILQKLCLDLDQFIYEKYRDTVSGGTTLSGVVLIDNQLYVLNIGDSKTVLTNGIVPVFATRTHRPNKKSEQARILAQKSFILKGRVDGGLSVSRCFGDYEYRKINPDGSFNRQAAICAIPDVTLANIAFNNIFIYTDGLGDYIDLLRLITVAFSVNHNEPVSVKLANMVVRDSKDNISIIHIQLR